MNVFTNIIGPKVLAVRESEYNGQIKILQDGHIHKVMVDNICQSMSHTSKTCLNLYWGKVIEVLKEVRPEFENVLILGLGGGTLAHLISENFNQPEIVSVDVDQVMVDVAKEFFDIDNIPNHKVIVEDALRVVVEPEQYKIEPSSFDVVIVDIFNGQKYPELGRSGNFVSAVCDLVKTGGLVIFDRIYTTHHQEEVNLFRVFLEDFLKDIDSKIVAGYTNSDNIIIYGTV